MKQEPNEEQLDKIHQAIFAGDRAEATSIYISIAGCGLTDAQEFIKKLTAELKETKPEKFGGKQKKKHIFWDRLIFSGKR